MNWLAHILLAESTPEARLGNLLGDLIKGKHKEALNPSLQRGWQCHQAIDIFTDQHPLVRRSKRQIDSEYRRFAGILIDVFYDYILANNWQYYSDISLAEFTAMVYSSWESPLIQLPIYLQEVINRMMREDWLSSYADLAGIEQNLARISWRLTRRTKRECDLTPAIEQLTIHYGNFHQDFHQFFPQLQSYINHWHLQH